MHAQSMWSLVAVFLVAALTIACAEARAPAGSSGASGGDGGGGATSANGGAATSSGGGGNSTSAGGAGGSVPVVINEIGPTGTDYVELKNTGNAAFALDDYALADLGDDGLPKLAEAANFPKGTTIGAGKHLLIVAGQDPADGVGPHDKCLSLGPDTCFYAVFGVSGSNGDRMFLLGPDDMVVAEAEYPKDAVTGDSTWGRLPDGTGAFAENKSTPGESNEGP